MAAYRWLAIALGRQDPRDFFVIFHRVFWRALRSPRLYPLPVNYDPAPRRAKVAKPADNGCDAGLTEDELERLLGGDSGATPDTTVGTAPPPSDVGANDDAAGEGVRFDVRVHGPEKADKVCDLQGRTLAVAVTVAPDDGRANATVIRLVGAAFGVQAHQVAILSGQTKADKVVSLSGVRPERLASTMATLERATTADGDDPFAGDPGDTGGFDGKPAGPFMSGEAAVGFRDD